MGRPGGDRLPGRTICDAMHIPRPCNKAQQAADGCHQSYRGLAPVLLRHQEDVEVGAERASHVRKQEVERVERCLTELGGTSWHACGCSLASYSHSQSVPIRRVRRVSGAPTLK
jgi:hypothetical protein